VSWSKFQYIRSTYKAKFICSTGVWIQDFVLARLIPNLLSHTSSPLFAQTILDWDLLIYASCCCWDDRHKPLSTDFFLLRWNLANFFAPLTWDCDPPNFILPSSWDYRYEPLLSSWTIHFYMLIMNMCRKFTVATMKMKTYINLIKYL
jgi:hypothetical protein